MTLIRINKQPLFLKRFVFSLILILMAFHSKSQEAKNDSITTLKEVVLLEEFVKKKALGITPSSSVGIQELERFGPIDFASGLNQISGLYVLSGALNTNRITIRGVGARTPFGTDKLRLYFNGIPVTNGTGSSTIEAFDFENMGKIEVVKGPKGTSLGSNLGGAIVLTTKPPEVGETFLGNSFSVGSYNMIKDNLSFRHSEKNFNINVAYNHFQTDGFRQNNSFDRDGLLVTSSVRVSPKGKLGFLVNYIDYTAQIPSTLNETDFKEDPSRAAANWLAAQGFEANTYTLAGLSYAHDFNGKLTMTNSLFYTYTDHYEPRPFNILDEFTKGFGFRSVINGSVLRGDFSLGAELYKDEYNWSTFRNLFRDNNGNGSLQGDQISRNQEFRDQLNVFAAFTKPLGKRFTAQLGLSLNNTSYDFRDLFNTGDGNTSAERDFDPIVLPNLGLEYQVKNGLLFANISRGFSNPGLEETLTPDGVINPEIEQEKGISYELGGAFSLLQNKLTLNATLYQMDIKDLLVAQRIGEDQFIGRNAGETRHQGFELDARYRIKLSNKTVLLPFLSYTLNNHSFVDFVDGEDDFSGNDLTGVPKNRIQSGVTLSSASGLRFTLNHQYVGEIPLTDAGTLNSESFHVFRANARYQLRLFKGFQLGLNAGINNIFDTNYAQSVLINAVGFGGSQPRYFYPGDGRNYYGGIQVKYLF